LRANRQRLPRTGQSCWRVIKIGGRPIESSRTIKRGNGR
jgi:hypothetical protein